MSAWPLLLVICIGIAALRAGASLRRAHRGELVSLTLLGVVLGVGGLEVINHRLSIGGLVVFERGAGVDVDLAAVRRAFEQPEIEIVATLGLADGRAEAWGCDLSEEYVRINAEYTT